jgi:hypothetical protein
MRALPTGTQETHLHRNIPAHEGTPIYHGGSFHSKYRVSQAREVTQVSNVMRRWEYARTQIHVHTQVGRSEEQRTSRGPLTRMAHYSHPSPPPPTHTPTPTPTPTHTHTPTRTHTHAPMHPQLTPINAMTTFPLAPEHSSPGPPTPRTWRTVHAGRQPQVPPSSRP